MLDYRKVTAYYLVKQRNAVLSLVNGDPKMPLLTTEDTTHLLTKQEADHLDALLTLLRTPQRWPDAFASDLHATIQGTNWRNPSIIADALASAVDQTIVHDIVTGLLYDRRTHKLEALYDDEAKELAHYLALRRSDSWLGRLIAAECECFADGQPRSPLQVVRDLDGYADQFDTALDIAQKMLRDHPDLVKGKVELLIETTSAEPEPATPQEKPAPIQAKQTSSGRRSTTVPTRILALIETLEGWGHELNDEHKRRLAELADVGAPA